MERLAASRWTLHLSLGDSTDRVSTSAGSDLCILTVGIFKSHLLLGPQIQSRLSWTVFLWSEQLRYIIPPLSELRIFKSSICLYVCFPYNHITDKFSILKTNIVGSLTRCNQSEFFQLFKQMYAVCLLYWLQIRLKTFIYIMCLDIKKQIRYMLKLLSEEAASQLLCPELAEQ